MSTTRSGWVRSSRCESGTCVEVKFEPGHVFVRDSKNPHNAPLQFSNAEWDAFLKGAVAGEFHVEQ
jgi:hypothetical protein